MCIRDWGASSYIMYWQSVCLNVLSHLVQYRKTMLMLAVSEVTPFAQLSKACVVVLRLLDANRDSDLLRYHYIHRIRTDFVLLKDPHQITGSGITSHAQAVRERARGAILQKAIVQSSATALCFMCSFAGCSAVCVKTVGGLSLFLSD